MDIMYLPPLPSLLQKTIVKVLKSAMDERRNSQGFLIDGFPREADQARMFEEEVRKYVCMEYSLYT